MAWRHDDGPFAGIAITRAKSVADSWIAKGWAVTPLYTAPPAPAVPDKPRLPPHVYRDLLDMLQETAIAYGGTQQLRAQLSSALSIHVQPDHPHTRVSAPEGGNGA